MPSLCQNSDCLTHFQFPLIVLSISHFLEMTMLISKTGTLIQIRIGVGSVTFPIMGPIKGQYVFLMTKSIFLCFFLLLILLFWVNEPHCIE